MSNNPTALQIIQHLLPLYGATAIHHDATTPDDPSGTVIERQKPNGLVDHYEAPEHLRRIMALLAGELLYVHRSYRGATTNKPVQYQVGMLSVFTYES